MSSSQTIVSGIGERFDSPGVHSTLDEHLIYQRHLFAYLEALPFCVGKKVVEIGCGAAYGTQLLADKAAQVLAIDTDADLIGVLKSKATRKIDFQSYDGRKIPSPDRSVDLVISFQVLEHVKDDLAFLQEIERILKPSGLAILTTPNRLVRLLQNQKPFNNYHYREYIAEELIALAERAKLKAKVAGVFGDAKTQEFELKRLRKYHAWYYRKIFQNLPRKIQMSIKRLILDQRKPSASNLPVPAFAFHRSFEHIERALDLWLELYPISHR